MRGTVGKVAVAGARDRETKEVGAAYKKETDTATPVRNIRDKDTIDQMRHVLAGMVGKRLMYRELTSRS